MGSLKAPAGVRRAMGRRRRDKGLERDIALARVARLMDLAERAALAGRLDRAHRHAALARALSLRHELGTPAPMRGRVCRACAAFLLPGVTSRTRVREGRVVTTCLACGRVRRRPLGARHAPRALGGEASSEGSASPGT